MTPEMGERKKRGRTRTKQLKLIVKAFRYEFSCGWKKSELNPERKL